MKSEHRPRMVRALSKLLYIYGGERCHGYGAIKSQLNGRRMHTPKPFWKQRWLRRLLTPSTRPLFSPSFAPILPQLSSFSALSLFLLDSLCSRVRHVPVIWPNLLTGRLIGSRNVVVWLYPRVWRQPPNHPSSSSLPGFFTILTTSHSYHSFHQTLSLIYGLVFFPTDDSALRVMVYLRFSETFKRRMGGRAFSYQWPPPSPTAVDPASVTCSIFVQRLQSSSCVMYLSVPLIFSSLPVCSSCPSPPPLPSRPTAGGSLPDEPGPAQGFSL